MKIISKEILSFQEVDLFFAIRDKIDYARLLLNSAKLLLLDADGGKAASSASLRLLVGKMSRLFLYKPGKFFSVSFPFNVRVDGEKVSSITSHLGNEVESYSISCALAILNDEKFRLMPSPIDFWVDTDSSELVGLTLLEEIFFSEPAYIRFDTDPERENGKLHPLNHLDINFSSYSTYKVGLNREMYEKDFEDMLDITTDCSFLL